MNQTTTEGIFTYLEKIRDDNFLNLTCKSDCKQRSNIPSKKDLKLIFLYLKIQKKLPKKKGLETRAYEKILVRFSVDQIAIMIRALCEAGVFIDANYTKLTRILSCILSTQKTENISQQSLRSKIYHPEEKDKEQVIRILEQMITSVKDM